LSKALAAIDGTVIFGKERNLSFFATACTDGIMHLTGSVGTIGLVGLTAVFAARGLVLETLLGIEFLLTSGESKF
jgi:hypothetical protein